MTTPPEFDTKMAAERARAAVERKRMRERQRRGIGVKPIAIILGIFAAGLFGYKMLFSAPKPAVLAPDGRVLVKAEPTVAAMAGVSLAANKEREASQKLDAFERRWRDAVTLADSTARIALAPVIADMQAQRREADALATTLPPCLKSAFPHFTESMDATLQGFFYFLRTDTAELRDILVSEQVEKANSAMKNYLTVKSSCVAR